EPNRSEAEKGGLAPDIFSRLLPSFLGITDEVPLVHGEDEATAMRDRLRSDLLILDGDPLRRIENQEHHIGSPQRLSRPKRPHMLDAFDHPTPLAHPRGIEQEKPRSPRGEFRVDDVACGPGRLRNSHPWFAQDRIEKR